jgi:NAD-dependent dihydropyrimidine dehydrogenase PreA subunit
MSYPGPLRAAMRRLSEGRSTVDWPRERLEPLGPARGTPVFDAAACTACGECVGACTAVCITLAEGARVPGADAGACVRCGTCAAVCPEGAVALTGPSELAAYARDDLRLAPGQAPAARAVGPSPSWVYRLAVGLGRTRRVPAARFTDRRADALRGRAGSRTKGARKGGPEG